MRRLNHVASGQLKQDRMISVLLCRQSVSVHSISNTDHHHFWPITTTDLTITWWHFQVAQKDVETRNSDLLFFASKTDPSPTSAFLPIHLVPLQKLYRRLFYYYRVPSWLLNQTLEQQDNTKQSTGSTLGSTWTDVESQDVEWTSPQRRTGCDWDSRDSDDGDPRLHLTCHCGHCAAHPRPVADWYWYWAARHPRHRLWCGSMASDMVSWWTNALPFTRRGCLFDANLYAIWILCKSVNWNIYTRPVHTQFNEDDMVIWWWSLY